MPCAVRKCDALIITAEASAAVCPKCGAALPMAAPSEAPAWPRQAPPRTPVWPLALMSLVFVGGILWLLVAFWPRGSTQTPPNDDAPAGDDEPALLIATPEGLDLLADVLEMQTTRVQDRRGRHAQESRRRAQQLNADADARKQIALRSDAQLRQVLGRLPPGPERSLLTEIAGKLSVGPTLSAQERLTAQKYPQVFADMLKITRSGLVPLRDVNRAGEQEQKAAAEKDRQADKRLEEQVKTLEQLGPLIFEDKQIDTAFATLTRTVRAAPDFGEARTLRGALLCLAKADYAAGAVDCDDAIRLDRRNAAAFYLRGLCHWKRGGRNQAGVDFQAAIMLEPRFQRYRELFDPRD